MEFKKAIRQEKKKHGKMLAATVLAAGLMLCKPARADSIELVAGHRSAVMDIKASADTAPKLGVFIRARPSMDYHGKTSSFALADLCIKLHGGLDAVAEVQAFGGKAVPRAGAQYFVRTGEFSLFTGANIGLDSKPYVEWDTELRYAPALRGNLKLLAQIENLSDLDSGGNIFSTQRMRLGVEWKGWGAGAATDLKETGHNPSSQDGTFGWNAGGFVSKRF
jgi:hypothetical protein